MIRYLLQRVGVLLGRCLVAMILLFGLIELSFGLLGGRDDYLWNRLFQEFGMVKAGGALSIDGGSLYPMVMRSLGVIGLAWGATLVIGFSWGILGARLKQRYGSLLLWMPWVILASVPGFWLVIQVAIYSFFAWERPGFADDWVAGTGPHLLKWWNAVVVSVPLAAIGISVQVYQTGGRMLEEMRVPFVAGLQRAGFSSGEVFYRHVLGQASRDLARSADVALPLILGGLVFVEYGFRFNGIGNYLGRCLLAGYQPGIFLVGCGMVVLVGVVMFVKEILVHAMGGEE